ncbi:MAG TPA: 7-carboxy-7-deazaguanine synthase QueE [Chthoniobacteraceae bacterium]|jgi:7-carboxy-7-deazaguanine synthase|nr:7-carboxy-7-deazaguanine synthase QueE [Chthoniobacteraceae bacterium]
MRIAEIFHSIQGEGELTGVPSVFVRTSGCNLRCTWCDTKYASWTPEGEQVETDEVLRRTLAFPAQHAVLTGGEPMLAKDLPALARGLRDAGWHITIETAGTIPPDGIACDLASISPKLSNSTPQAGEIAENWRERHEALRLQPAVLREWIDRYPFQLKFVVESGADLDEIDALLREIDRPIRAAKILLMPQGIDVATLQGRDETLVDLCLRRGFRYCQRLHVSLFGNRRGT